MVQADATLEYELVRPDADKIKQSISISGRWLRLDSSTDIESGTYTVMDTGRMLMFRVNDADKSFQITKMGRLYWPVTRLTAPNFKPVQKKSSVNGIRCQPVQEIVDGMTPVAEHCMLAGGALGLNARETITLSRLFMSARRLGLSWPGVATADERQVSALSRSMTGVTQQFISVDHQRIDNTRFKIPRDYRRLLPDLPVAQSNQAAGK